MNKKFARILLALAFVAAVVTVPRAPQAATTTQPPAEDRVALYQALLDLQNPWTVMCVAAHPDDEDGTSLIVMRHKYGAHTVSLFSTFGEGGQNAIGPELYEELGAIRARETMAAAEIQGSEPFFLGLKDFGFSKTRDEAFRFWGHEEALRRMVLQIRKLRPDVIITNHSTTSNDHGQHQATALMVVEAFDAAADATKFPEQLKDGVTTWQVQRLFVRTRGNQQQAVNTQIITIDPNEKDPVRGVVYAEEALRGLQQHATQGPWPKSFAEYANRFRAFSGQNAATGQLPMIRYTLVKSATGTTALPNDSHNFLDGLQLPGELAQHLAPPTIEGKPLTDFVDRRDKILDALITARKQRIWGSDITGGVKTVFANFRRAIMLVRLNDALAAAAGVSVRLIPGEDILVPGETASFKVSVTNKGSTSVRVERIASGGEANSQGYTVPSSQHHENAIVASGQTKEISGSYKLSETAWPTVPHAAHLYDKGFAGTPLAAGVHLNLEGAEFEIVTAKLLDVAPAIEISQVTPSPAVMTASSVPIHFTVTLSNHESNAVDGKLFTGKGAPGLALRLAAQESKTVTVSVEPPANAGARSNVDFSFRTARTSSPLVTIPVIYANARVVPNLAVGYIRGFDFSLPNALNALGVESKELSVDDVKAAGLSKYTSVIVDNRVYESKPELIAVNQKLLDYAQAGGNLIVFYHKSDEWNPDERRNRPQLAPFKLILGGERITDENAPISFLEPDHPLLNMPNKMGQDDFKDWIQERGLYYPKEWDPQFHALLQSNDPGEQPLKGGLLVADYGKGHYIYTSMVWYRELRGGIPGAYRMLANMISYGAQAK